MKSKPKKPKKIVKIVLKKPPKPNYQKSYKIA